MLNIFHDLRYAFRSLLKHRNFAVATLLTLALGIGINTSIFTLLYSLAFREFPVKNPERVVNVYQRFEGEYSREVEGSPSLSSFPEYLNYRNRVAGKADLIVMATGTRLLAWSATLVARTWVKWMDLYSIRRLHSRG